MQAPSLFAPGVINDARNEFVEITSTVDPVTNDVVLVETDRTDDLKLFLHNCINVDMTKIVSVYQFKRLL